MAYRTPILPRQSGEHSSLLWNVNGLWTWDGGAGSTPNTGNLKTNGVSSSISSSTQSTHSLSSTSDLTTPILSTSSIISSSMTAVPTVTITSNISSSSDLSSVQKGKVMLIGGLVGGLMAAIIAIILVIMCLRRRAWDKGELLEERPSHLYERVVSGAGTAPVLDAEDHQKGPGGTFASDLPLNRDTLEWKEPLVTGLAAEYYNEGCPPSSFTHPTTFPTSPTPLNEPQSAPILMVMPGSNTKQLPGPQSRAGSALRPTQSVPASTRLPLIISTDPDASSPEADAPLTTAFQSRGHVSYDTPTSASATNSISPLSPPAPLSARTWMESIFPLESAIRFATTMFNPSSGIAVDDLKASGVSHTPEYSESGVDDSIARHASVNVQSTSSRYQSHRNHNRITPTKSIFGRTLQREMVRGMFTNKQTSTGNRSDPVPSDQTIMRSLPSPPVRSLPVRPLPYPPIPPIRPVSPLRIDKSTASDGSDSLYTTFDDSHAKAESQVAV